MMLYAIEADYEAEVMEQRQLRLFEVPDAGAVVPLIKKAVVDVWQGVDWEGLEDWAFLYTASFAGGGSGILFMMRKEEAKAWCSSDLSCGGGGARGSWAYFWTSVSNYLRNVCGEPVVNLKSGKYKRVR